MSFQKKDNTFAFVIRFFCTVIMLLFISTGTAASQSGSGYSYYLPFVSAQHNPALVKRVVNAPYIPDTDVINNRFREMAVFWFGKVEPDGNYADVRVGYNDTSLSVFVTVFDRRLWYNETSNGANLTNWDSVTITLHTDPEFSGNVPASKSYQFTGQLVWWELSKLDQYMAAYQGNGTGWSPVSKSFSILPQWRGNAPNDSINDHGWIIAFDIPFSSLGLSAAPAKGTTWRFGVKVNDRDSASGAMSPARYWPETFLPDQPGSWGVLRFGQPGYKAPASVNPRTTTIRHKLNGNIVIDAHVGGATNCGGGSDHWTQWGNKNYAGVEDLNVQNQRDVSDFVCFSKIYMTFPLKDIPPGKVIRSATLVMHQFGGADPANAYPSIIQVSRVKEDWNEGTITWNNAPLAVENVSQTWVSVFTGPIVWPGEERRWDVSSAAAYAYSRGDKLRLALYSADEAMHSGKYFKSSETVDWNVTGTPTLIIEWGDPN